MQKVAKSKDSVSKWLPDYRAKTVKDIDFALLSKKGILNVAIDIDGTMLEGGTFAIDEELALHVAKARKKKHIRKLVIATNRFKWLAHAAAVSMKPDAVVNGGLFIRKPNKKYFMKLQKEFNVPIDKIVMIGDRVRQDIYGANRVGMVTILVDDLGREPWYERIVGRRNRQHALLKKLGL